MKTEKTIYGLQQCYNMINDERINYPDHEIDWSYKSYEEAHDTLIERSKNSPNIYFKMYSKTEVVEFIGNYTVLK